MSIKRELACWEEILLGTTRVTDNLEHAPILASQVDCLAPALSLKLYQKISTSRSFISQILFYLDTPEEKDDFSGNLFFKT